jgi:CheY-like chemotaxis protein
MLGFARGGKYEVIPLDLNAALQEAGQMFGSTHKDISVHFHLHSELWTVEADQNQIEQVLLNLFVNAQQAMPEGGSLHLQTRNVVLRDGEVLPYELAPGRYVKVSVTDSGVGMDARTQERVFEPFFTTKQVGQGTGLGLASAYGIIKNHKGMIEVTSDVGRGTTFDIYLPASDKADMRKVTGRFMALQEGSETVLLVDDEEMIRSIGRKILERLGYTVHVADGGPQALRILEERGSEISLVVLDMVMPGMGGSELFDRIKVAAPGVRVLLSSGYSLSGQAAEIFDRGCHGFIQKPFDIATLSNKVREILDDPGEGGG